MFGFAKIIGIGNAGIRIVEKLKPQDILGRMAYETIAVDTDKEGLECTSIVKKVQIGIETMQDSEIKDKFALGKSCLSEQLGNVIEAIDNTDFVFIVAGFGSGVTAGATVELATNLKLLEVSTFCFAIKPFCFEGQKAEGYYNEGIKKLSEKNVHCVTVEADNSLNNIELPKEILQQLYNDIDFTLVEGLTNVLKES